MCGIAGYAGWSTGNEGLERATLDRMCAVIRHRGPDDQGVYCEPGVGLGMRRLSIIDLATGHQPMPNEDRTVWVVFNGEIYNFVELRAELERDGHRFRTASDTEAVVHGYEQWGERVFSRLRGMFGIAVWDARARRLLLGRDRAGIKPLHYSTADGVLRFGSEIKSVLAAGHARTLDLPALDHYLSFLYTPRDGSIFGGIQKLPPGHLLSWQDGSARIEPYWQLGVDESFDGTDDDAAAALRDVLRDAVRCHLISDVPLGAFLSGGIDSSLVVALMAEVSDRPVRTFSIGFDEPSFDELEYARIVARHFGTEHHEFTVKPDALAILETLVSHFDEPFGDSSAIPTWYVSQTARQHVTVVLSGDGGDELFGGYDRYLPIPSVQRFDRWAPPGARLAAGAAWRLLPHGATGKNFLRHVARNAEGRYLEQMSAFRPDEKRSLYSPDVRRALDAGAADAEKTLGDRFNRLRGLPWQSRMMHFDFETYLPEDVLTKVDRMSMAHSIESRVPLLDNDVIEFAATLPASMKIREGRRKHVFKKVAESILPRAILERKKQGFGVPIGSWFRGGVREIFGDVLLSRRARDRGYFNQAFIEDLVRSHVAGRADHSARLWQLLVFELWHREYLDRAAFAADSRLQQPVRVA
jgi:asparagine synthase (glutamine-hydrolysing)